jgi:hypothetical protein
MHMVVVLDQTHVLVRLVGQVNSVKPLDVLAYHQQIHLLYVQEMDIVLDLMFVHVVKGFMVPSVKIGIAALLHIVQRVFVHQEEHVFLQTCVCVIIPTMARLVS